MPKQPQIRQSNSRRHCKRRAPTAGSGEASKHPAATKGALAREDRSAEPGVYVAGPALQLLDFDTSAGVLHCMPFRGVISSPSMEKRQNALSPRLLATRGCQVGCRQQQYCLELFASYMLCSVQHVTQHVLGLVSITTT